MLMKQIGSGLLYELKLEVADLVPLVLEGGDALVRVILRVRHERQRECRPRPRAVRARVAPDPAELWDDGPVARSLPRAVLADDLSALQRHQNISGRHEAQCDTREEPRIATLDLRTRE